MPWRVEMYYVSIRSKKRYQNNVNLMVRAESEQEAIRKAKERYKDQPEFEVGHAWKQEW